MRRQTTQILFLLLVTYTLFMMKAFAQQAVDLAYRFQPGATFQVTFLNTDKTRLDLTSISRRAFRVLSTDEQGTATIEMKIDFVETHLTLPGGSIQKILDTRNSASHAPLVSLLLHPVTLKVDRKGRILSVTGLDEGILDSFYNSYKPASDNEKRSIDHLVATLFSEAGIRENLPTYIFPPYPETPTEIGSAWTTTQMMDLETAKLTMTRYYTLKDINEETGEWHIGLNETVTGYDMTDPAVTAEIEILASDGHYHVQSSTGLVQSFDLQENIRLSTFNKNPDGTRGEAILSKDAAYHFAMDTQDRLSQYLAPMHQREEHSALSALRQLFEIFAQEPALFSAWQENPTRILDQLPPEKRTRLKALYDRINQEPEEAVMGQFMAEFMGQCMEIVSQDSMAQALMQASDAHDSEGVERLLLSAKSTLVKTTSLKQKQALLLVIGMTYMDLGKPNEGKAMLEQALMRLEEDPEMRTAGKKNLINMLKVFSVHGF